MDRSSEKGAVRPLWLAAGVITCVLAGSTLNQCLNCFSGQDQQVTVNILPNIEGHRLDAPLADEPEADLAPAEPEAPLSIEDTLRQEAEAARAAQADPGPAQVAPKVDGDHVELTFDKLASYEYTFPEIGEEKPTDQIPENVLALGERKIAIKGFMIPIKTEGEDVLEFVLVRNQFACCFGVVPKMNEWVHVTMAPGKTAPYALDIPITVYGTLAVGELWENGVVMSLYRLKATEVVEPAVFR